MSPFSNNIDITAKDIASTLTGLFRTHATSMGWPSESARQVHVRYKEGNLDYDVNTPAIKEVDDLEYGSLGNPPLPAMRTFKATADSIVSDVMGDAWSTYLFGDGNL